MNSRLTDAPLARATVVTFLAGPLAVNCRITASGADFHSPSPLLTARVFNLRSLWFQVVFAFEFDHFKRGTTQPVCRGPFHICKDGGFMFTGNKLGRPNVRGARRPLASRSRGRHGGACRAGSESRGRLCRHRRDFQCCE